MGAGKVEVAVSDAGPLVHLNEVGCLSLLHLFEALHIPEAVWEEIIGAGRVLEADVIGLGNILRHDLPPDEVARFVQENGLDNLHSGERECLYLCRKP